MSITLKAKDSQVLVDFFVEEFSSERIPGWDVDVDHSLCFHPEDRPSIRIQSTINELKGCSFYIRFGSDNNILDLVLYLDSSVHNTRYAYSMLIGKMTETLLTSCWEHFYSGKFNAFPMSGSSLTH